MSELLVQSSVRWIPVPHTMRLFRDRTLPDPALTTAGFVLVRDRGGHLLLTHVNLPGRGWDVPGGHVDEGEDLRVATVRELAEETGLVLPVPALNPLGRQEFWLDRPPPDWYHYPYPRSHVVYFCAQVDDIGPPVTPAVSSECGPAGWFPADRVRTLCAGCSWLPLVDHVPAWSARDGMEEADAS